MPSNRDREERPRVRIDARSSAAKAAGVKNAKFDGAGNLIGGTFVEDRLAANGSRIFAGSKLEDTKPQPRSNIDRLKAGELTPRLTAFDGANSRSSGASSDPVGPPTAVQAAERRRSELRKANPREYWDSMSQEEKRQYAVESEGKKRTAFDRRETDRNRSPRDRRAQAVGTVRGNQRFEEINSRVPGSAAVAAAGRAAVAPEARGIRQTAQTPYGTVSVVNRAAETPVRRAVAAKPVNPVQAPKVTAFQGRGPGAGGRGVSAGGGQPRNAFAAPNPSMAPAATVAPPRDPVAERQARLGAGDAAAREMFGGVNSWAGVVGAARKVRSGIGAVGQGIKQGAKTAFDAARKFEKPALIATY